MEFANKEMDNVVLSVDGRKEVHDYMRPFRNGKGSYDFIIDKFKKFADSRNQQKYYVRGTFTHHNLDFSKDVMHLADAGFEQISVEPVVAPDTADYAITEAGFGEDLGAEKFLDIKCRQSGLDPAAIVIVATARALKMHGGTALADLKNTDVDALKKGLANLDAHLDAAAHYKRPVVVAVNKFFDDSREELDAIVKHCAERGIPCAIADIFSQGGEGGKDLAQMVVEAADRGSAPFKPLYESALPVEEKLNIIARNIYGADGVELTAAAKKQLAQFEASRLTDLPVCMAKTQNSLSDNGRLRGRPTGFTITVRDFEIANGAGFLVALCGEIMRMPALPVSPNAMHIYLDNKGNVQGL